MARANLLVAVAAIVLICSPSAEARKLNGLLDGLLGIVTSIPLLLGGGGIGPLPTVTNKTGPFLYVWAAYGKDYTSPPPVPLVDAVRSLTSSLGLPLPGAAPAGASDFLATIDLNTKSATYGKFVGYTPIGSFGNEPHHISVDVLKKRVVGSGLLSFIGSTNLPTKADFYGFDISDPSRPKYLRSITADGPLNVYLGPLQKGGAVADHVFGLSSGNFLTTQMGAKYGNSPGSLAIFNNDLTAQVGPAYNLDDVALNNEFDPHGADIKSFAIGAGVTEKKLLTSDFVNPLSTVTSNAFVLLQAQGIIPRDVLPFSDIIKRSTVRLWDFQNEIPSNPRTIILPGAQGVIDVKWIPGTGPFGRFALATGVFGNQLYWVDTTTATAGVAYSWANLPADTHPHLMAPVNPQGTRFLLSLNKAEKVVLLDTTNPKAVTILDSFNTGAGSSPHYITPIGPNDNRYAIADYFLDQGIIGSVHAGGNKRVFVVTIVNDRFVTDKTLTFNFGGFPARPHGIATNYQYTDLESQ